MSFAIVVDSTLEFPDDINEQVHMVPLYVKIGDKVFKDREIEVSKLFELMREEGLFAKTSQPSPMDFESVYSRLLKDYDEILSIHISSKLSGTLSSASLAAEKFNGRVKLFDSETSSMGAVPYVEKALLLKDKPVDEVIKVLEKIKEKVRLLILVKDMEFLKMSGRVSNLKHFIGSLMRVKPIIDVRNGELVIEKLALGMNKAVRYLKDHIKKTAGKVIVGHILNEELAKDIAEFSKSLGRDTRIIGVKSSVLSAHLGPGGVCVLTY